MLEPRTVKVLVLLMMVNLVTQDLIIFRAMRVVQAEDQGFIPSLNRVKAVIQERLLEYV